MPRTVSLSLALSIVCCWNVAVAGDVAAGKARAGLCSECHGDNGIGVTADVPNLAGQKAEYLASALRAYRDRTREEQIMNAVAVGLSDEDISNLAAYYASLE